MFVLWTHGGLGEREKGSGKGEREGKAGKGDRGKGMDLVINRNHTRDLGRGEERRGKGIGN